VIRLLSEAVSVQVIIPPPDMFWRQMGGHLRKVETCSAGVTWGVGYDNTAWVYTGGWGGSFLKGEINLCKYKNRVLCCPSPHN
jgi:hypothetical protein